ncbi:MAG TPA: type II toxin-antitoxin system VapC family toxin [Candidatus Luteococcus avicola]|nr:type II toxin-antitoxin system VapC family toxin [Candidatus Luteococcus avicola]
MIGLDTNVVVRILVNDDDVQHERVLELLRSIDVQNPAFVSQVVLVETWWVLTRRYKTGPVVAASAIRALLASTEVVVERQELVRQALDGVDAGADFADALIDAAYRKAGCERTLSFNRAACQALGWEAL